MCHDVNSHHILPLAVHVCLYKILAPIPVKKVTEITAIFTLLQYLLYCNIYSTSIFSPMQYLLRCNIYFAKLYPPLQYLVNIYSTAIFTPLQYLNYSTPIFTPLQYLLRYDIYSTAIFTPLQYFLYCNIYFTAIYTPLQYLHHFRTNPLVPSLCAQGNMFLYFALQIFHWFATVHRGENFKREYHCINFEAKSK